MKLHEMYAELRKRQKECRELDSQIRSAKPEENTEELRNRWASAIEAAQEMSDSIMREEELRHTDRVVSGEVRESSFSKESEESRKKGEYRKALDSYMRNGYQNMSSEERKALQESRAMNTGVPADGGFVVDTQTLTTVQEEKVTWGAIYAAARKLRTQKGNPISWPVSLEGMTRGVIVGEGENHGKKDTKFKNETLGAFKISSQIILVTDELLQDAFINIPQYVTRIARQRVELGIDYYAVNGAGGDREPKGVLLQIADNKKVNITVTGAVGSATWGSSLYDGFIDVIHAVDPAYRNMPSYGIAVNDKTLASIRKWKDENGHPIYVNDVSRDWPETLFGKRLIIDNQLPDLGTDGAIIAGDFNALLIREAGDMVVKRFDELYGETGQVGFLAWQRFGVVLEDVAAMAMATFTAAPETMSAASVDTGDSADDGDASTGATTATAPSGFKTTE